MSAEIEVSCIVNGEPVKAKVKPAERLVDLLSRAGEDDPPVRVSFSRIHGEHATFLMADDRVDRFGEHADRYDNLNFFGEAKDSQKD